MRLCSLGWKHKHPPLHFCNRENILGMGLPEQPSARGLVLAPVWLLVALGVGGIPTEGLHSCTHAHRAMAAVPRAAQWGGHRRQGQQMAGPSPGHSRARHAGKGGMLAAGWEHALPVLAHGHRPDGYLHCKGVKQKSELTWGSSALQQAQTLLPFRGTAGSVVSLHNGCRLAQPCLTAALLPLLPTTLPVLPPSCCRTAGHCSHHLCLCLLKPRTEVHGSCPRELLCNVASACDIFWWQVGSPGADVAQEEPEGVGSGDSAPLTWCCWPTLFPTGMPGSDANGL